MGCACSKVDSSLQTIYKLKTEVGDGAEATVWLGKSQSSQTECALKMIPTAQIQSADMANNRNLLNEVPGSCTTHLFAAQSPDSSARRLQAQALARLGPHVNIVRFNEVVLTDQHVVLVMEWVGGGTLSSYCRKRPYLSEEEALYFFKQVRHTCTLHTCTCTKRMSATCTWNAALRCQSCPLRRPACSLTPMIAAHTLLLSYHGPPLQLVSAVEFCHKHHLAHRDIKLENVMVDTTTNPPRIKLADFGLSKHWEPVSNRLCRMQTIAGTPGYISPEVRPPQPSVHPPARSCTVATARRAPRATTTTDTRALRVQIVSTMFGGPNSSYDGTKADVWALGVALVTLLLHHKPYAYSALQNLSVKALLRNMHHQQLHTRWLDTPQIRDNLPGISTSVRDLLSAIFVSDASQRITMAGIQAHPWFQQRLNRRYQNQLDAMAAEQRQHTAAAASPAFSCELQERLQQLQQRLAHGGVSPGSLERVSFEPTAPIKVRYTPAPADTYAPADKGAVGQKAAAHDVRPLKLRRGIVT
jgi:serine/threonine protein kinase